MKTTPNLIKGALIEKHNKIKKAIKYFEGQLKTEKNNIKRIEIENDIITLKKYL